MSDVFISYARPDEAQAKRVADALTRARVIRSGATMSFLPIALMPM